MSPRAQRPRWGQNFLIDSGVASSIVSWAAVDGRAVVEIGPGRGALTDLLVPRARRLIAIEIDPALADDLGARYVHASHVSVVQADALAVDLRALEGGPFLVLANLPYETGTAILRRLVAAPDAVEEAVVMLQREVCARILAAERTPSYGALSIHTQVRADVVAGRIVGPQSFRPHPKVESQLLRVRPLAAPRWPIGDEAHFEKILRASFSARRKMLRNTLVAWLGERLAESEVRELLASAGIEERMRPEEVSPRAFARLSNDTYRRLQEHARAS